MDLSMIKFDDRGLVPAIAQDIRSGQVLMLAYMSVASLEQTLETGLATYYSRSRGQLWQKGETSGHVQRVQAVLYDCDGDTLLLKVEQVGPACHTGQPSCFFNRLQGEETADSSILQQVYDVIASRKLNPKEGSYTNYLLAKGTEKIAKKVGEEATEVVIAAIKDDADETVYESADLLYHLLVLLCSKGISLEALWAELKGRR